MDVRITKTFSRGSWLVITDGSIELKGRGIRQCVTDTKSYLCTRLAINSILKGYSTLVIQDDRVV